MTFPLNTPDLTPVESSYTYEDYLELSKSLKVTPEKLTKPFRVYADVDGMIFPYARSKEDAESFDRAEFIKTLDVDWSNGNKVMERTGLVWWDDKAAKRLSELSKNPLVDFVWLTSFNMNAPYAIDELLDIESVGFLPWSLKMSDYNQSFKGVAIRRLNSLKPAKFIWLDDRANYFNPNYSSHYFADFQDIKYDDDGNRIILTEDPRKKGMDYIHDDFDNFKITSSDYLNINTDEYIGITLEDYDTIDKWIKDNS